MVITYLLVVFIVGAIIGRPTATLAEKVAMNLVGALIPSFDVSIGDFDFSLSLALAFGNASGVGFNFGVSYNTGNWSFSAGVGYMHYGNYNGFGNGVETRNSIMAAWDDGSTGFSLGTNFWNGKFKQQTGIMGFRSGDFRFSYENDGWPYSNTLGDGGDSNRSAALNLGVGDFSAGFNIFTGERDSRDEINGSFTDPLTDSNGKFFPRGYVNEAGTPHRLGTGYFGYKNFKIGINSERYISYPIQTRMAHGLKPQGGFPIIDYNTYSYFQYRSKNSFTLW